MASPFQFNSDNPFGSIFGFQMGGMGGPGGCVAGAGTNIPVAKAQKKIQDFVKASTKQIPPKELEEIQLD